jgi:hypothetical protein
VYRAREKIPRLLSQTHRVTIEETTAAYQKERYEGQHTPRLMKDKMKEQRVFYEEVYERVTKKEFDQFCKDGLVKGDPMVSTFGDDYGEPYNPNREAFATLKNGRRVWAWVIGPKSKED